MIDYTKTFEVVRDDVLSPGGWLRIICAPEYGRIGFQSVNGYWSESFPDIGISVSYPDIVKRIPLKC